jgi:phosphoadenylyl-sulfate reductase (thioredoxin)
MDDDEAGELATIFDPEEPEVVLEWAFEHFGADRLVFVTSFQRDGMVLLDMASKLVPEFRIATIDTGMLPGGSLEFVRTVEQRYRQPVEVYRPDEQIVARMTSRHGAPDFFYRSVDLRLLCCHVRKVLPLYDVLATADAWVTGLRRDQWATRGNIRKVEVDHDHGGVVKLNPLADWPELYVLSHIAQHDVPEHPLYAQGFTTIGCAPCTRAVPEGEDPRSGRWWWEENAPKECGMHCSIETGGFEQEVGALLGHDAGRLL